MSDHERAVEALAEVIDQAEKRLIQGVTEAWQDRVAYGVLASSWLAARDEKVRADERARIAALSRRDDIIAVVENWVPLGFDPVRDPYRTVGDAARGILAAFFAQANSTAARLPDGVCSSNGEHMNHNEGAGETSLTGGWFADIDLDADPNWQWQPCLDLDSGYTPCLQMWFATKGECEAFILDDVIPVAGRMT